MRSRFSCFEPASSYILGMSRHTILTYEQCKLEGAPFLAFINQLVAAKLIFTGSDKEFSVMKKTDSLFAIEYKNDGFIFGLVDFQKVASRSKVINLVSNSLSFPSVTYPRTKATSYVFKTVGSKSLQQPKSFDVGMMRLKKLTEQAHLLMVKSGLPDDLWVDLVATMYCAVRKSNTQYYPLVTNMKTQNVSDTLKFLKLGLEFPKIFDAWERNIDPSTYKDMGSFLGDLPEEVLEAMFSD